MLDRTTSEDKFLYHYTKAPIALNKILKGKCLRFGRYINTNDPQETKNWEFSLCTNEGRDLGAYPFRKTSELFSAELKSNTHLICFSMDTPPLVGDNVSDLPNRGYCKPRMWAQYADNHTGVCLIFDKEKLEKEIFEKLGGTHFIVSGPVHYTNSSIIPNLNDKEFTIDIDILERKGIKKYAEEHIRSHVQRLYFQKMMDWENEREWRWVVFSPSDNDIYININNSLSGIIFGERTNDRQIKNIMKITNELNIWHMGLKWKNSNPWYDYGNLKYINFS